MRSAVELADVHDIAFVFQHCRLVVVDVEIIRSGENGHDRGETSALRLAIHPIPVKK